MSINTFRMRLLKYLSQAIQVVLMLCSVGIGAAYVAGQFGIIAPLSAFIILSGSMEPAIGVGSISVVQAKPRYTVGDVITFSKDGKSKMTVTHRVAEVRDTGVYYGDPQYVTRGDANEESDSGEVKHANVAGRVMLSIPYLGYIADFAKTPRGFVLLIVIPATIIIYEEIKNIKRQFAHLLRSIADRLEARKLEQQENIVIHQGERSSVPKIAVLIPAVTLPFVFMATTHAIYADTETSAANAFVAASEYDAPARTASAEFTQTVPDGTPTPSPTPLQEGIVSDNIVINEFLWDSGCENPGEKYWFELVNKGTDVLNVRDWRLTDGNGTSTALSLSDFSIQPGEYILVTKNSETFSGCYTNAGNARVLLLSGTPNFTPGETGGILTLEKSTPTGFIVLDRVEYGPIINGGMLNTSMDQSIARTPDGTDMTEGGVFTVTDFQIKAVPSAGIGNP